MTGPERAKLLRAILAALLGMLVSAALHVLTSYCTRYFAATLQPFSAVEVYSVQLIGFVAAVCAGGAVAGLVGGDWGGLGGGLVGLASGTGIRECIFGWVIIVIPAWPQAPGPGVGFSVNANTALLVATTAHMSTRGAVWAVLYAVFWVASVVYAGWAGAAMGRHWISRQRDGSARY